MATPSTRTPIRLARGTYSNLNNSIADLQEGEIVYATDQNNLYVKEGSVLILVTTGLLDEDNLTSNSALHAASQQSIKAYVDSNSTSNLSNTANGTSLTVESSSGTNTALPAATTSAWGVMTDEDKTKLDGIATNANNYTHPTSAGNVHIPSGGSSGQFLKYTSDGTAVWAADNDTTYSVGDGGLTTNDFTNTLKTKLDGIATGAEVNVQSDWNSSSGDSQILNKPTIPTNNNQLTNGASFITSTTASVASSANGMRKITTSTSAPSGGSDGDVWFKYTA